MPDLNEDQVNFATVYAITRHYGGPEEGGWWYNWYEPLKSIAVDGEDAFIAASSFLTVEFESEKYGNIYSVLGGQDIEVLPEAWSGQYATKERPHYE